MKEQYIIGIDQSTQGTKALLFNQKGKLIHRSDRPHRQIVNEKGWVSHDLKEIYENTLLCVKDLIDTAAIDKSALAGIGISNQRETTAIWNRTSGEPLAPAIVWQCSRAKDICDRPNIKKYAEDIKTHTGIPLSPYFPAAKIAWLLEHVPGAKKLAELGQICHGTIDTWLIYKLTGQQSYKTDYSNASRTQLFDIFSLQWREDICAVFGISAQNMAEVCESDSCFGWTDFDGYLEQKVPIHCVLGDSHAALLGQGCIRPGMLKATYGTGSSIMMNIGSKPLCSTHGLVTSLAWGKNNKVEYVLEGNLNYTGAVITWLKDELGLISSPQETAELAKAAQQADELYLVPAFSGLGAPYWDSNARAAFVGMTRTTKKAELVRAAVECIAYQIRDVVSAMSEDAGIEVTCIRGDGGPTSNPYLMQFQSDILQADVKIPDAEELSGIGAAYEAGRVLGIWDETVYENLNGRIYHAGMTKETSEKKIDGWKQAVKMVLAQK